MTFEASLLFAIGQSNKEVIDKALKQLYNSNKNFKSNRHNQVKQLPGLYDNRSHKFK